MVAVISIVKEVLDDVIGNLPKPKERRSSLFVQAERLFQSKTRPNQLTRTRIIKPRDTGNQGQLVHRGDLIHQEDLVHGEVQVHGTNQVQGAWEQIHKSSTTKGLMKCPKSKMIFIELTENISRFFKNFYFLFIIWELELQ